MKLKVAKYLKQQSGYTLVEVLLVLMLMVLVVGVITMTYFTSAKTSQQVISASTAERKARVTIYSITRELREAGQVTRAESSYITFLSDINSDQVQEEVNYYLQSEGESFNLFKLIDQGEPVLMAQNILNSDFFTYYSPDQQLITDPVSQDQLDSIGIIEININIDNQGASPSKSSEFSTYVSLRNNI